MIYIYTHIPRKYGQPYATNMYVLTSQAILFLYRPSLRPGDRQLGVEEPD